MLLFYELLIEVKQTPKNRRKGKQMSDFTKIETQEQFDEAIKESFVCPRTDANLCCKDNKLLINLSYNGAFGFGEKYNKINQKQCIQNRVNSLRF